MSSIISLKTEDEELEVQYDVITAIDINESITAEKVRIIEQLSSIEQCIAKNQQIIDNINNEIDKLTNHADSFDYTIAVASGILSGLIDSFFVGEFSLDNATQWGKQKVDSFVKHIAKWNGYSGDSLSGAISFLEDKFPIPADKATNIFGGGLYHHLRDFSHFPNAIGLIFSLLTQFTEKVYGTDKLGAFIIKDVPNKELIGKTFSSKISIGFVNWFFHMVSDMAGSSSSYAKGKYGTGLPGPVVSLLKVLSSLPFFSHKENTNKFCIWVSRLFNGTLLSERDEKGKLIPDSLIKFDLRAEIGVLHELGKQALPVIINECLVRITYFIRRLTIEFKTKEISSFEDFVHIIDWNKTLPFKNRTIVRMITIASGTFVAIDAADAAIRASLKSGGEPTIFFANMVLRVNFVGVGRFAVAIGTDTYMGYKHERLRDERLYRMSEHVLLGTAKIYYKQADMWIAAKEANEAVNQMKLTALESLEFLRKSLLEIGVDLNKIASNKESIEQNNPGLLTNISDILIYGK